MHVQFQLVVQTHNVLACQMESPNVRVCQVSSKVQTQFVAALNRRIHVNHSHAVLVHHAMLREIQFAIAQNRPLEIHSDNVIHLQLPENCVDQDHVEVNLHLLIIFRYFSY